MTTVDVIVPVFNGEKYIERCIKSVLCNKSQDIEVKLTVVDDGSTDRTSDIVTQVQDGSIQLLKQENLGVAAARNHGLDKTNGDYVVFLDADDWLADNGIEALARSILKYKTEVAIGKSQYYVGKIPVGATSETWHPIKSEIIDVTKDYFLVEITPGVRAKMFNRRLLEHARFPKSRIKWEDLALVPALLAKAKTVAYTENVVYNYTVHLNTTVKDFLFQCDVLDIIRSLDALKDNLENYGIYEQFSREYHSMMTLHTLFRAENVVTWMGVSRNEKRAITKELLYELSQRYPEWRNDPILTDSEKRYKDAFFNFLLKKLYL